MKRDMILNAALACLCILVSSPCWASSAGLPEKPIISIQDALNLAETYLVRSGVVIKEHYISKAIYGSGEKGNCWTIVWAPTGKGEKVFHHVIVYMDKTVKTFKSI